MKSPRKLWGLAGIFLLVAAYGAAWTATANAGATKITADLRAESAAYHDIQVASPAPFIVHARYTLGDGSPESPAHKLSRQYLWLPGHIREVARDPIIYADF